MHIWVHTDRICTSAIIDAPENPQRVEDEVGLGLSLHTGGDELHLIQEPKALEDGHDATADHGRGQFRPAEFKRDSRMSNANHLNAFQMEALSPVELPGIHGLPSIVDIELAQDPTPGNSHVVHQVKVSGFYAHLLFVASLLSLESGLQTSAAILSSTSSSRFRQSALVLHAPRASRIRRKISSWYSSG